MRSMLFLPADSERKIAKGADSGADGLILDMEDSVAVHRKDEGRKLARAYLDAHPLGGRKQQLWCRINPLDGEMTLEDLSAVVGGAPDGLLMPKYRNREQVIMLDHWLTALEAREGVPAGHIKILVIATETAEGVLNMNTLPGASPRVTHVSWGEFDLGADIGAQSQFLDDGSWDDLYRLARAKCLATAIACGAEPCNTVHTDFRDEPGLREAIRKARLAGFTCMPAIHPNQIAAINEGFGVSEKELDWSRRVVAVFEENPDVGVAGLDGIMLDKPHYTQAKKVIARAEAQGLS